MTASASPLSLSGRRLRRAAGERIAELFEEHARMVYGICRLILRDPTDAEDAAQQTFLSAYGGLLAGQEPREPSAWLGTIARNECRSRLRSRMSEPLTLVTEPSGHETEREVNRRAEAEAIAAALAELPPPQRDAIVLREFYGLSYSEVAAALGLSGAAVESLLFRSRRRLQDQLRPFRVALGTLALPPSLRDQLAQSLPGFGGGGAGVGVGAAALTKLGSAPLAAKLAAATLAVGAAGTVAGVETGTKHHSKAHGSAAPAATRPTREASAAPRSPTAPPPPSAAAFAVSVTRGHGSESRSRGEGARGPEGGRSDSSRREPQTETDTEPDTTTESHHDGGGGGRDGTSGERGGGGGSSADEGSGSGDDSGDSPDRSGPGDGTGSGTDSGD